ncbi:MAG: (Fe-S)-binding protein [Planctomycetaceae bacterium]
MKVALFIPCYVDQFYPQVGMATVRLLEHFGIEHEFPAAQTCCGQPMANSGCMPEAAPLARRFIDVFDGYDYIVAPSGSCVSMVRHHYDGFFPEDDQRGGRAKQDAGTDRVSDAGSGSHRDLRPFSTGRSAFIKAVTGCVNFDSMVPPKFRHAARLWPGTFWKV